MQSLAESSFTCPICEKVFETKSLLVTHVLTLHSHCTAQHPFSPDSVLVPNSYSQPQPPLGPEYLQQVAEPDHSQLVVGLDHSQLDIGSYQPLTHFNHGYTQSHFELGRPSHPYHYGYHDFPQQYDHGHLHHQVIHLGSPPKEQEVVTSIPQYDVYQPNCSSCDFNSENKKRLEDHISVHHNNHNTVHCKFCDKTFHSMLTLNLHTHQEHVVPPQDSNSEDATPIVQSNSEVLSSSFSQDSENGDFDVSDIMQIDGNVSIESIESQNSHYQPLTSSACIRTAPYTLNKEKQLSRLGRNAALNDFDIDVNSDTNINIQCSSGFYQVVAKPTIASLLVPGLSVAGVPVYCSDPINPKLDQMKRNVNAVVHFKVGEKDHQESATIHLHHTQQKVQVQGRAAHWFVYNVLKDIFEKEAENQELSIRNVNNQLNTGTAKLRNSSSSASKSCSHCNKQLRTKSLSICISCCQSFHNSKTSPCFQSHPCNAVQLAKNPSQTTIISSTSSISYSSTTSSAVVSELDCNVVYTTTPSVSSLSMSAEKAGTCEPRVTLFSNASSNIPHASSTTTVVPSPISTIMCSAAEARPSKRSRTSSLTDPSSSYQFPPLAVFFSRSSSNTLNVPPATSTAASSRPSTSTTSAALISIPVTSSNTSIPTPVSSTTACSSQATARVTKPKQKKSVISPEQSEINFLKLQLNAAITKITQLDNVIQDNEKRISILSTTLKSYEERDNRSAYEQYFPNSTLFPPQATASCPPCPPAAPPAPGHGRSH